jgi:hypothetical protein
MGHITEKTEFQISEAQKILISSKKCRYVIWKMGFRVRLVRENTEPTSSLKQIVDIV